MNKEKIKVEPLIVVREVLPGDRITLAFQKAGYIYFQAVEVTQLYNEVVKK